MAFSLGWPIVIACFGVGFPLIVLLAEWRALRTGDAVYTALAKAWAAARFLAERQPVKLAALEGLHETQRETADE